jgi:hypothetical protein
MDKNIYDERFEVTFNLSASIYTFTYHGSPHRIVSTTCIYARDYILANVPDIDTICSLHYTLPNEETYFLCKSALLEYYELSGDQCVPL